MCETNAARAHTFLRAILVLLLAAAGGVGTNVCRAADPPPAAAGPGERDPIAERIRARVEAGITLDRIPVGEELVLASEALPAFYTARAFRPAWCGPRAIEPRAVVLVKEIGRSRRQGLRPEDYHLDRLPDLHRRIEETLRQGRAPRADLLADFDLLLTDAFMVLGSHYLSGRVNPETIDPEWTANRRGADFAQVLSDALAADDGSGSAIERALRALLPGDPGYERLRRGLDRLRGIEAAGGWGSVPDGTTLHPGDRDPGVIALRRSLRLRGDLAPADSVAAEEDLFDDTLADAVRRFQERHGLDADRVVGRETRAELAVPVERRIEQVELNLERWRWLPQVLGRRHIIVNVPAFELDVFEEDRVVLSMKVVVGQEARRTPVFTADMTYLVFSPSWNVPPNIAVRDLLPAVRKDPGYLKSKGIRVLRGWGAEQVEVEDATVDWQGVRAGNLPYHFRQDPGPLCALGRVKFMLPNPHNVYLHDTPSRELFGRTVRTFSSGCIRIEKPKELAVYLLAGDPRWNQAAVEAAMQAGTERTVVLRERVPVHLLYWTAWADDAGRINFRRDVYRRDERLERALREEAPES